MLVGNSIFTCFAICWSQISLIIQFPGENIYKLLLLLKFASTCWQLTTWTSIDYVIVSNLILFFLYALLGIIMGLFVMASSVLANGKSHAAEFEYMGLDRDNYHGCGCSFSKRLHPTRIVCEYKVVESFFLASDTSQRRSQLLLYIVCLFSSMFSVHEYPQAVLPAGRAARRLHHTPWTHLFYIRPRVVPTSSCHSSCEALRRPVPEIE